MRPPRHQSGTPFFYLATDQWRYERIQPGDLASPLGRGLLRAGTSPMSTRSARDWDGCRRFRALTAVTLDLVDEAQRAGRDPAEYVVRELRAGRLRFACEDPDAPENHPKVMTVWRLEPAWLLG